MNDEKVYLKKSMLGWNVVYPIKNIDGSINWKNIIAGGNWWKLLIPLLFVIFAIGSIVEYTDAVKVANECLAKNQLVTEGIKTFLGK